METMHWNLTQYATRAHLLDEACKGSAGLAEQVRERAAAAGVPDEHHHHFSDILQTIDNLQEVPEQVRDDMRAIYRVLAEAEAQVHESEVDHTHFHEVGNGSHIQSVLEICLAVRAQQPQRITATAVQVGSGQVECAHGLMDIPAPATAAILSRGIPAFESREEGERCTPTSAAVIYHFVDEFISA